ncbi:MAG: head GIN domain-containing protein [Sediminicola sp.]
MRKKSIVWFIALVVFSMDAAYGQDTITLERFSELKVFDAITVELVNGDTDKVIVEGIHKDAVTIQNSSGRMKIRLKLGQFKEDHGTKVTLFHSRPLVLLDANEKATISSKGICRAVSMAIRSQEGSRINLQIETERVEVKATTAGIVSLTGTAKVQDVHVNTGGIVNNEALITAQTDVSVNAGGRADINATEIVEAIVRAGGTITIHGNPKEIGETKFVGGQIITVE